VIVKDYRTPRGRDEGPVSRPVELPSFMVAPHVAGGGVSWREQNRNGMARKTLFPPRAYVPRAYERVCEECGVTFTTGQPQSLYCRPYHRQLRYRRLNREVVLARRRADNARRRAA
jgi:hypothetical protein